ncbi:MAG: histidinol dehydrogenase [Paludibacteraceae bacterium]|nr:histidinol dehydrogenase [Paludibacteraceae bacterium]
MKIYINPDKKNWAELLSRPVADNSAIISTVQSVLDDVRQNGDAAIRKYEKQFDKADLDSLKVSDAEIAEACSVVSADLKSAIRTAISNISKFHSAQLGDLPVVETTEGVKCWQKAVAIEKVGLYIPGGTAPLFSTVLMLAVPAKIAGCSEIVLCTPPSAEGKVNPAILFAASEAGVTQIYKTGGVQAIAAMAYGTESVPKVYKIFGPGNPFVTTAKQIVSVKDVAIDMPAGPSEIAIIADDSQRADIVAADMLSQAEHGTTSQSMVFTTDAKFASAVMQEAEKQCSESSRREFIAQSLSNSRIFVLDTLDDAIDMCNAYAPEHLIISCRNYADLASKVVNAGSVFLGYYTPESAGDYASGTNHTLPTSGYAKAYSGVNMDSFIKKITFQEITKKGLENLGGTIEIMAENEYLSAHKNAVLVRNGSKI